MEHVLRTWDRWAYAVTAVGLVAAAVSGMIGWLFTPRLEHWLLLGHVTVGPVFIVGLIWLALRLAERCRFGLRELDKCDAGISCPRFAQKVVFWVVLPLAFVSLSSVLGAMWQGFANDASEILNTIHRVCGVGLVMAGIVHMCLLVVLLRKRRG